MGSWEDREMTVANGSGGKGVGGRWTLSQAAGAHG